MNVLFLGPSDSPLVACITRAGDDVTTTTEPIDGAFIDRARPDFLVSYGYRHILRKDVLDRFPGRAINLHISYLPWNRGADPNFWSLVEGTPRGVTIHYLDEGVDTGDIIAQEQVVFASDDTLRTSYDRLQTAIQSLFRKEWPAIRAGTCARRKQEGAGTVHRMRDKERLLHLLTDGWDTPISLLTEVSKARG